MRELFMGGRTPRTYNYGDDFISYDLWGQIDTFNRSYHDPYTRTMMFFREMFHPIYFL